MELCFQDGICKEYFIYILYIYNVYIYIYMYIIPSGKLTVGPWQSSGLED